MTTEQENKIIEQAQDIMARRFAVENELKLNAQSVAYYGAYYLGAIQAVQKVVSELTANKPKGDDWVYLKAFWDCITKDKRALPQPRNRQERQTEKRGVLLRGT